MGVAVFSAKPSAVFAAAADAHAPAANTAAVVTYAAVSGFSHVISGVMWSYTGGTPTGGNLTITVGADTVLNVDLPNAGAGFLPFDPAKKGTVGAAMVITLAAGGGSVVGKVTISGHWTET